MNIKKYLARIGISECEEMNVNLDLLKTLQTAHITSVPYENLDIIYGKAISLDEEDIYDKIVTRHRGGYCFELNALYEKLLLGLGFQVESFFARFLRGQTEIPVRRHRVLVVTLGAERYMADVGIGSPSPRAPLLLKSGITQECFGECYRFEREEFLGWVLYEMRDGKWQRYLSFTEEKQLDIDFIQPSFYCEKHPASIFNRQIMVAIKTPTGRKTIDGDVFKIFEGAELVYIKEKLEKSELEEILSAEFGIKT